MQDSCKYYSCLHQAGHEDRLYTVCHKRRVWALYQQLAIPQDLFAQLHGLGSAQWAGLVLHPLRHYDVDAVVDEFARQNPQRLQLCNFLYTDEDD